MPSASSPVLLPARVTGPWDEPSSHEGVRKRARSYGNMWVQVKNSYPKWNPGKCPCEHPPYLHCRLAQRRVCSLLQSSAWRSTSAHISWPEGHLLATLGGSYVGKGFHNLKCPKDQEKKAWIETCKPRQQKSQKVQLNPKLDVLSQEQPRLRPP